MNIHKNARLTLLRREEMALAVIAGGLSKAYAARLYGVSAKVVARWVERYEAEGRAGMVDRSSRPGHMPRATEATTVERIVALRRVVRYERDTPGELIHLDIKKLGRFHKIGHRITGDRTGQSTDRTSRKGGAGWEFVHICIDDASRIAFSQILPDEKQESAVAFLKAAIAYYASLGVTVSRVMTDNGGCYKSRSFRAACNLLGLKHIRTRPYTPKTNGKAERFIQTALREWAYAKAYPSSDHRGAELPVWLHRYNWHRPHGSLKSKPPISRLGQTMDNLLSIHS